MVGSEGVEKFSDQARQYLTHTQNIVLDYPSVTCPIPAAVQFCTAIYGIHRSGTAYRMDEVPIPLRPLLESPLSSDDEILTGIYNALR